MSDRAFEVRIEELVVTGFPLVHPERLAPAVESLLAERLAAPATGSAAPAGDWELTGSGADDLAETVASSVESAIRERLP